MPDKSDRDYPERRLMAILSDLLGIPHFPTARGSTVKKDFLEEVATSLSINYPTDITKDGLLALIWAKANGKEMPEDRFSPGSTVTNNVLQEIIDGIIKNEIDGRPANEGDEGSSSPWLSFQDDRRRRLREITIREGSDAFRESILNAYGSRCAVTRSDVPAVLEAAHIIPYRGPQSNDPTNGLCLRRDIHALFDRRLLTIDENNYRVILAEELLHSPSYADFHGVNLHLPRKAFRPDRASLRMHRLWVTNDFDGTQDLNH